MNIEGIGISNGDIPNSWFDCGIKFMQLFLKARVLSIRYSVCYTISFSCPKTEDSMNLADLGRKHLTGGRN